AQLYKLLREFIKLQIKSSSWSFVMQSGPSVSAAKMPAITAGIFVRLNSRNIHPKTDVITFMTPQLVIRPFIAPDETVEVLRIGVCQTAGAVAVTSKPLVAVIIVAFVIYLHIKTAIIVHRTRYGVVVGTVAAPLGVALSHHSPVLFGCAGVECVTGFVVAISV